jgi:GT2 family glycosyltransferase
MITIALTYFNSLGLANLAAALYSVATQDPQRVDSLIVFDNDTADAAEDIERTVHEAGLTVPWRVVSVKHGRPDRTHAWSTNAVLREVGTPWVLFTRADYLLDPTLVSRCAAIIASQPADWDGFITGHVYHLSADVEACERTGWRAQPQALRGLPGSEEDYTCIDAGVWAMRPSTFAAVGGLEERLTAWGHAQTHFQYKLHQAGVACVRIPEVLFYHPFHAAERDLTLAHAQLAGQGIDLHELWKRHPVQVYP